MRLLRSRWPIRPRHRKGRRWHSWCRQARDDADGVTAAASVDGRWSHPFSLIRRFLGHYVFSSLTRRILFLNLAGARASWSSAFSTSTSSATG